MNENFSKPSDYFQQTRPEILPFIPLGARRILDIGCAEGRLGGNLKKRQAAEVWGIEIEATAADQAKQRLDQVLLGDVVQRLNEVPDKYFDVALLIDSLEHFVDPYSVLREIKHKLSSEGVVVLSIPNVRYFFNLWNLVVKKDWNYEDSGILDRTHLRFFTKRSLCKMFSELGYELLDMQGINGIESWKFTLLNILSLNWLEDTRFVQFACVVRPHQEQKAT